MITKKITILPMTIISILSLPLLVGEFILKKQDDIPARIRLSYQLMLFVIDWSFHKPIVVK